MRISISCFALLVYVVYASEKGEKDPVVNHLGLTADDAGYALYRPAYRPIYVPVYQPRYLPGYQPRYQLRYQPAQTRGGLSSLLQRTAVYYLIRSLLFPPTTTAARASTTVATTPTIATTAAPETTEDPLADWTMVGSCRYFFSTEMATWVDADAACQAFTNGARLAVTGFNKAETERSELLTEIEAGSLTFWLGAKGVAVTGGAGAVMSTARWSAPFETVNPSSSPSSFALTQTDNTARPDPPAYNLCGRTNPDSTTSLLFEDCAVASYRYVCEYCEA